MESSQQARTATDTTRMKSSIVKGRADDNLESRGIYLTSTADPKRQQLNFDQWADHQSDKIELEHLSSLLELLEAHTAEIKQALQERALEDGFPYHNALRSKMNEWRPACEKYRRFAPMSDTDFDLDKKHCSHPRSSEADFQRILMMSIVDRFDFRDTFAFTCDEQWEVKDKFMIPATFAFGRLTRPKPDLSFDRRAIRGEGLQEDSFSGRIRPLLPPRISKSSMVPILLHRSQEGEEFLGRCLQPALCQC